MFINCGISGDKDNKNKYMNFYFYKKFPDNSTFDQERVKKLKIKFDRDPTSIINIPIINVNKLHKIAKDFFSKDYQIHLLNIDTEGFEYEIIESFFIENIFPWIICVEELGYFIEDIGLSNVNILLKNKDY